MKKKQTFRVLERVITKYGKPLRGTVVSIWLNYFGLGQDGYKVEFHKKRTPQWAMYRADEISSLDIIRPFDFAVELEDITPECIHDWKTYDSGFSKYEYCDKCGTKKKE